MISNTFFSICTTNLVFFDVDFFSKKGWVLHSIPLFSFWLYIIKWYEYLIILVHLKGVLFRDYRTAWFLGQISIKYLRIWMGSEMLVAEGWLWLKSIIKTGAKQMAKFWGFILLREDWAVTFDKWSITWTRQFWNERRIQYTIACCVVLILERPKDIEAVSICSINRGTLLFTLSLFSKGHCQ